MGKNKLDIYAERHLATFNPEEPLIWRLRLSHARFAELENIVSASSHEEIMSSPISALTYLAEWYKWRYSPGHKGNQRHFNPTGEEIKALLEEAGIDTGRWVATNPETGRHSWMYSVYVLGGLPVAQELNRGSGNSFLRNLCRMYHGEKLGKELDDSGRAEAFRLSLKPGGSLYGFIQETTGGGTPFAEEDLEDNTSPASQLMRRIKEANDETLRDKFRIEWRITAPPGSEYFSRRICLNLQPEYSGEGHHQYLMYDRVRMWGFEDPASLRWLDIGIRYKNKGATTEDTRQLLTYTNTYHPDRGFLSVGVDRCVTARDVPTEDFDTIEIYATADNGETHTTQEISIEEPIQVYATDTPYTWSNSASTQNSSAVLWSSPWHSTEPVPEGLNDKHPLFSRRHGIGKKTYNLTSIPESLTLTDGREERTFYDHQGRDILCARRHDDTIRYHDADKVWLIIEDEDGMEDESPLPLLMTREDIIIRRVMKDEFGETTEETIQPDAAEWKNGTRYEEWTEENPPKAGIVRVRCTTRGRQLIRDFAYTGGEIARDLQKQELTLSGNTLRHIQADMESPLPTAPTIPVSIGNILLDVWQPIRRIEINKECINVHRTDEASVTVPVIRASELWAGIFNEKGYQRYDCKNLEDIHCILNTTEKIAHLTNGTSVKAKDFDITAPDELEACMSQKWDEEERYARWILWDYLNEPQESSHDAALEKNTVLFQNLSNEKDPMRVYTPQRRYVAIPYSKVRRQLSLLECFKTAAKYKNYYFIFTPFEKMTQQEFDEQILMPLKEEGATEDMKKELQRLARELQLSISDRYLN